MKEKVPLVISILAIVISLVSVGINEHSNKQVRKLVCSVKFERAHELLEIQKKRLLEQGIIIYGEVVKTRDCE